MSSELYILRHSKSDWDSNCSDHERPLNKRGQDNARQLAQWMKAGYLYPGMIFCSTAVRARQTLAPISDTLEITAERVLYKDELYLATLPGLLTFLCEQDADSDSVMIVGHNPGLDELVTYISREPVPLSRNGKLMTTSCLAHFKMPDNWCELAQQAELISITRPEDLVT